MRKRNGNLKSFLLVALPIVLSTALASCAKTRKIVGAHETQWKQKEIIITYSVSAPPTETNVQQAALEGFNMIPASEEALGFAATKNMTVMLEHGLLTPKIANDSKKLDELNDLVARVKNHPALGCYYLFDEPVAKDIPKVAKLIAFIRERDPKHFCFVNMLPVYGVPGWAVPIEPGVDPSKTYSRFMRNYIETAKPDLLSYDFYNFLKTKSGKNQDKGGYFANLILMRDAAQSANLPFINIIQASTMLPEWRRPTAAELRWQVYTTLAYGGRGISYFLYWGPKKYGGMYQDGKPESALVEPIVQLNKEMKVLSPTLMSLDSKNIFTTDPDAGSSALPPDSPVQILTPGKFLVGMFSESGKLNHFMLVNTNYTESTKTKLKIAGPLQELNRKNGSWSAVSPGGHNTYEIEIEPGDGRLFRFGTTGGA